MEYSAGSKAYYALLFFVLVAILIPIWIVDYPGMADYPNHLVRCYILAHYHENPIWQQRYVIDHTPLPNLAIELVVVPLLRILPILTCGKLFLSLAAVLYVLGSDAVGHVITGKPNWLAPLCAFTFYNIQLFDGLVNYIFGIGIFLLAFAFWLRVRRQMAPWSFLVCCLLSLIAYLAHLSSIAFLGLACLTVALLDYAEDRKLATFLTKLAWLACPLLLIAAFFKGSGQIGAIAWSHVWKLDPTQLLSPIKSYSLFLDIGILAALTASFVALSKGCTLHRTATVSAVFFLFFLITPDGLFTAGYIAQRFVVPGCLLLVLSIEPHWGWRQKAALGLALATMMVRTGEIAANWVSIDRESKQVLAMGEILPRGASVFALQQDHHPPRSAGLRRRMDYATQFWAGSPEKHLLHVIQFWTLSHDADVSTLFAIPGQQPLVFRQLYCHATPIFGAAAVNCFPNFDFVWTYDAGPAVRRVLAGIATPAATWGESTLWRVNRASPPFPGDSPDEARATLRSDEVLEVHQ